jgi:hypothetical protein
MQALLCDIHQLRKRKDTIIYYFLDKIPFTEAKQLLPCSLGQPGQPGQVNKMQEQVVNFI